MGPAGAHDTTLYWAASLITLGVVANAWAWFTIGALPDEAYYWVWSQRLQWGYFDHPPLVAWLIRPFTALFGDSIVAIRLPAVLAWLVSGWLAYHLASRIYRQPRAGMLALLVWTSLPIVQAGFHVVTPDTSLVLFGWLSYYFVWRAVDRRSMADWLLTGLCTGLALLGKYPGVLLFGVFFLALLSCREGRRELSTPGPWLAAAIAALMFLPVVWWNSQHDWISFAFQLGHGVQSRLVDPWRMFSIFLGGQLGVVLPWTFFAMFYASLRPARWGLPAGSFVSRLLVIGFWLPLLLFGSAGLTAKAEANWPLLAYLPGCLLLAGALSRWLYPGGHPRKRAIAVVSVAYLVALLLVNGIRFPWWLEQAGVSLPPQRTQLSQSYGWAEVGRDLKRLLATEFPERRCRVMGASHQETAMLALLLGDATAAVASPHARFSQYTLWAQEGIDSGMPCLYVRQFDRAEQIVRRVDLGPLGHWRRIYLLELHNPDLTERWFGFFVPEVPAPGGT